MFFHTPIMLFHTLDCSKKTFAKMAENSKMIEQHIVEPLRNSLSPWAAFFIGRNKSGIYVDNHTL